MRRLALVLLLLTLPASAQRLTESIEVHVVNVDVVVTDRQGNRIHGLTARDFELFEDKLPQSITNFYEVRDDVRTAAEEGPAAPADPRQHRRFAFFLDNDSLHPALRRQVLASMRKFVETNFRPGDEAALISFKRAPKIVAPMLSDRSALLNAIDSIAGDSSPLAVRSDVARVEQQCLRDLQMAQSHQLGMRVAYDDCISQARLETQDAVVATRRMAAAINVTLAALNTGTEAKKVLVLAGARMPMKPGADVYHWANMLFSPYLRGFYRPTDAPTAEPQAQLIDDLARLANNDGVTMYFIHARASADVSSVQNALAVSDNGLNFMAADNTAQSYNKLAKMTGGIVVSRTDFEVAFTAIARDLGSYYSLGYKPVDGSARDRNLLVRARNRDYVVRARQTFAPKTADEQMSDRVVANVFSPAPPGELAVRVRTGKAEADGGNFKVPVEVTFPSTLTLLPDANAHLAGGFTVYIAVGNENGALSDVARRPQPVSVPRNEEAQFRAEPVRFTMNLTVRPGENWLSVGVVDQVGGATGLARATIVAK